MFEIHVTGDKGEFITGPFSSFDEAQARLMKMDTTGQAYEIRPVKDFAAYKSGSGTKRWELGQLDAPGAWWNGYAPTWVDAGE